MSFLRSLPPHGPARDTHILAAIAAGRLTPPRWYRLRMGRVELDVSRDYLAIDGDRCPMAAPVAQAAVDSLAALLPTPAIVDAIEREPAALVTWLPAQTPGAEQVSAAAFERCEVETRRILAGYTNSDTALLAGHRKDVVLAPWMPAGKVVIFGARWVHGPRIQPLFPAQGSAKGHEIGWNDYAQGVRAVRRACLLDGKPARLDDVLAAGLCGGPVARLRYPLAQGAAAPQDGATGPTANHGGSHVTASSPPSTTATTPHTVPAAAPSVPEARPTPTISAVLRRGSRGPQVVELQTLLAGAGHPCQIDGQFGPRTEAAVRAFQSGHGLTVDGLAGPKTITALRGLGDTERPPPDVPPALSDDEVDALFGPLLWTPAPTASEPGAIRITNGWQKVNLRKVVIPQLVGVEGAPKDGAIFLHRLVVEQTRALWAAWEKAGLLPLVLSWAGSWNPRLVRGGSTLSRHAYAVSWDVNAAWNPMGKAAAPRGAKGSVVDLVPLAVEHGYTNGMNWSRPDPMHFEVFRTM